MKDRVPTLPGEAYDGEAHSVIYNGANAKQLAKMFGLSMQACNDKIRESGVQPKYRQGLSYLYSIKEIAPYLVQPAGGIEEAVKKMNPRDLPPALIKEFWNGQRARLRYEEDVGDLRRTESVISAVTRAFTQIRLAIQLFIDEVERETVLTDKQQQIIQQRCDNLLRDINGRLTDEFQQRKRASNDRFFDDDRVGDDDL